MFNAGITGLTVMFPGAKESKKKQSRIHITKASTLVNSFTLHLKAFKVL